MKCIITLALIICSYAALAAPTHIGNVQGYTLNQVGKLTTFTDLVFDGGKVLAIGNQDISAQYPAATFIDGKQQILMPGLIDAHGHVLGLGETLLEVDVRDIASAKASAEKVRDYAQQNPSLDWILGRGWNQVLWPGKQFPNAAMLDEYIQDRPVWITRVDGHAGWANSKALEMAGVTRDSLDPPGGQILRDKNGNPSGILIDNAMNMLTEKLPQDSEQALKAELDAASKHLLSLGITSVHDAGVGYAEYEYYIKRSQEMSLDMRIYAMIAATDAKLVKMLEQGPVFDQYDYLAIRSVKVYGDGALGSRGAAMLSPYSDEPHNTGLLLTPQKQLKPLFDLIIGSGFQLNIHEIGDRGNRLALDQFEDTFTRIKGQSLRNRVEHAQVIDVSDIPRFKTLGIIPSMQPTHATSDMNMAQERIGKERLKGAYAWQTFEKQGSMVAFGSDFPVELANPFFGLHAAVTRQSRQNQPDEGWIKDEAVSIEQAFKAFTLNAAYAAHQEKIIGTLSEGKWADFILVDQDIFTINPQNIWKTKVLETWVGGIKRFDKAVN
ncbi:amidohydrolase [Paraglaciecola polaris]|uniref:Predicted metal-dependent amidohydrolase with the TIM-barrel fold protein n=1 Tax=Paraglaciecola polaris LMG 21857 TaxID=1129793 RepID=K6ZQC1_9ALTE|nr:amidohydrolase [Paraglaciecola polaris]GAC32477.1 predicted metal-dependent amidohydrolase with the TIM-barrel fold protein [Paraglaciecola polaris LMG 21857]|tara:strand:+ start:2086 stop:3738 length:1653 start_codon:yes stop_codon:yes gene_type:complete